MLQRRLVLIIAVLFAMFNAGLASAAEKRWKNATEGSMVATNGNSSAFTTSGKNTFEYSWTKVKMELIGGGLGAKNNGENTAEKYYASEKMAYILSERNYLYEKYGWDKDRFAGIKSRHDMTAGFGRALIKTDRQTLLGELGAGRIVEERKNQETNSFETGRAYSKYTYKMSETGSFSQDAEFLANFDNSDDFRVNTETALLSALSTHLALKVSYLWKYVGDPPAGIVRSDTTTSISLVATY